MYLTLVPKQQGKFEFYNDRVLPGTDIYSGNTPHLEEFAREAFAPLGWKFYHYALDDDVLKELGAKCV